MSSGSSHQAVIRQFPRSSYYSLDYHKSVRFVIHSVAYGTESVSSLVLSKVGLRSNIYLYIKALI